MWRLPALTESAYFLHKAASFSSGEASVVRACISKRTSFPVTKQQVKRSTTSPLGRLVWSGLASVREPLFLLQKNK